MGLQLRDLIHHSIGHHVEAKEEVVFVITEKGFVGVAAARVFVFIEPCSRESILEIFDIS